MRPTSTGGGRQIAECDAGWPNVWHGDAFFTVVGVLTQGRLHSQSFERLHTFGIHSRQAGSNPGPTATARARTHSRLRPKISLHVVNACANHSAFVMGAEGEQRARRDPINTPLSVFISERRGLRVQACRHACRVVGSAVCEGLRAETVGRMLSTTTSTVQRGQVPPWIELVNRL